MKDQLGISTETNEQSTLGRWRFQLLSRTYMFVTMMILAIIIISAAMSDSDECTPRYINDSDNSTLHQCQLVIKDDKKTIQEKDDIPSDLDTFVFLEEIHRIKVDENQHNRTSSNMVALDTKNGRKEPRKCLIFARHESSRTDHLLLAICQPEYRLMSLKIFELRQFNHVIFRGNIAVNSFGPSMQMVEIQLDRKIYTDIHSLIKDLKKGQRDAFDFQKQHDLPSLKTLEAWASGEAGFVPEVDLRKFLYIGSHSCLLK